MLCNFWDLLGMGHMISAPPSQNPVLCPLRCHAGRNPSCVERPCIRVCLKVLVHLWLQMLKAECQICEQRSNLEMDFPVPAVPAARDLNPFQAYMSSQLKTHHWETDKAIPTIPFWNPWSTECVIMGSLFYSGKCEVGLLCSNNTGIQRKYFIFYKSVQNLAPAYLFNICSNFLLTPYTQTNQVLFSDPTINQCIFTH